MKFRCISSFRVVQWYAAAFVLFHICVSRAEDDFSETSKRIDSNSKNVVLKDATQGFEVEVKPIKGVFLAGEQISLDFVVRKRRIPSFQLYQFANPFLERRWASSIAISVFDEKGNFIGWIKQPDVGLPANSFPPPESSISGDDGMSWRTRIRIPSSEVDEKWTSFFKENPGKYKVLAVASGRFVRGNRGVLESDPRHVQYAEGWASSKLDKELCRSAVTEFEIVEKSENSSTKGQIEPRETPLSKPITCSITSVKQATDRNGQFLEMQISIANDSNDVAYVQNWSRGDSEPDISPLSLPVFDQRRRFICDFSRMQENGKYRLLLLKVARVPPGTMITQHILIPNKIGIGDWSVHAEYDNSLFISEDDAMRVLHSGELRSRLFRPAPNHCMFVKPEEYRFDGN